MFYTQLLIELDMILMFSEPLSEETPSLYKNHMYVISAAAINYRNAKAACRTIYTNGHLTSIWDEEEYNFITGLLIKE